MAWSSNMTTTNKYIVYEIGITENWIDVGTNVSNVTVQVWITRTNSGYTTYGSGTVYCKINGTTYSAGLTSSQKITNSGIYVFSKTLNIPHNSDGTKTLACSAWFSHSQFSSNEQSYSQTLTTIPRKSTMSVGNGTLNTAQTLTVSRNSTSFTHTITYTCGSYSGTICTKSSSTSISWTPPLNFANGAPNGTSVYVSFDITTYNGNTSLGSNSYAIWCAIPASVKPSCSVSVQDPTGYLSTYGGYVQNKSTFKVTVSGSGSYSSTISSYKATANGANYTSSTFTTAAVKNSGTQSITATVTDSRGRTSNSASASVTVLAYTNPKITAIKVERCDSDGTKNEQGSYVKVTYSYSVTSLNSKNAVTGTIKYKKTKDSSYTSATISGISTTFSATDRTYIFSADTGSSYDIILSIGDNFGTETKSTSVSTATSIMHWLANGLGMAIGKIAELKNALEIGWDTYVRKSLVVNGTTTIKGTTESDNKNLFRGTSSKWSNWITPTANANNYVYKFYYGYDTSKLVVGAVCTIAFDIEFSGVTSGTGGTFVVETLDCSYKGTSESWNGMWATGLMKLTSPPTDGVYHFSKTFTLSSDKSTYDKFHFSIRADYWGSGKYRIRNVKFEIGDRPTDWTQAPEDSALVVEGSTSLNGHTYFGGTAYDYFGLPMSNGVTMYTGSGDGTSIDPNTTLYELVLTDHTNDPGSGFWYIRTMFYGSKSTTSNRCQYAYPYNSDTPAYYRYYYNGTWSSWLTMDSIVAQGKSGNWYYRKWSSGWAEVVGSFNTTVTTIGNRQGARVSASFPFTFVGSVHITGSFACTNQAWSYLAYVGVATTSFEAYGDVSGSTSGTSCYFRMNAFGFWK